MDDRQVVAAIAAGSPQGIAVAYDKYAAALYDYCRWMLPWPADAAGALRDTFVAATTPGSLPEAHDLRAWLYSVARQECLRRLSERPTADGGKAEAADQPAVAA